MNTVSHPDLDAQREIIRANLTEIANDIGMAMRDVGLHFPIFLTVRDNGDSLATIATPIDPPEEDWRQASEIVCQIMGRKLGTGRLTSRALVCAVANSPPTIAAEVTAGWFLVYCVG